MAHGNGGTNSGHGGKKHHHGPSLQDLLGTGGKNQPPFLSYDPSIEAERRAAARGLLDVLKDTRIQRKQATQDFRSSVRDLKTTKRRALTDLSREKSRGLLDFTTKMAAVTNKYGNLQQSQSNSAASKGVFDASTLQSSADQRAYNQQAEETPLKQARDQLLQDVSTQKRRSRQDFRHDKRLSKRDWKRTIKQLHIQAQRARREQAIGNVDLINQEIFDARSRHPGVYGKSGGKL